MPLTLAPTGPGDTAAIQAAFNTLPDEDVLTLSPGRYQIQQPLARLDKRIRIVAPDAYLCWNGSQGTMLTLGFSSADAKVAGGGSGSGWRLEGLRFHHMGMGESYFANPSTALCWQNLYASEAVGIRIDGFGTGLSLIGNGTGCAYNRFHIPELLNCQTMVKLRATNNGFCTENDFHGKRWQQGPASQNAATTHVDAAGPNVGACRFINLRLEGWGGDKTVWANIAGCVGMHFLDCGYDTVDGTDAPIILDAKSYNCALVGAPTARVVFQDASSGKNGHVFRPSW